MEDRETLVYGFIDDVYVVLHRGRKVDERDWQAAINGAIFAAQVPRLLFVAGDLMPDVGQRFDLSRLQEKHATKMALMSDSSAIGRVVTALKWSGIEADGFSMDDLVGVLQFLACPTSRARMSSALGPYLDRSWKHEVDAPGVRSAGSRASAAHRNLS